MDSKSRKIKELDPNGPAPENAGIFGLPFTPEEADVIIYPVPWEVTVSYSAGTSKGPEAILAASSQVDLYDPFYSDGWKNGYAMLPIPSDMAEKSASLRKKASKVIGAIQKGKLSPRYQQWQKDINKDGAKAVERIKKDILNLMDHGKMVIMLGGDHSTPLGFLKALTARHPSFGILHIDAHMDLRKAYEGFKYSHASIMYNALQMPQISQIVQVGIRDFCQEEVEFVSDNKNRVSVFYDREIKERIYAGDKWKSICEEIVKNLPEKVYISFDIDGLDPKLCPNTGTPVPGGFELEEVLYLCRMVTQSGKKIIGIDLNEVAPGKDEWDANVGARALFALCNILSKSRLSTKPVR